MVKDINDDTYDETLEDTHGDNTHEVMFKMTLMVMHVVIDIMVYPYRLSPPSQAPCKMWSTSL